MITVWLVDGDTRLHMPSTDWAEQVLQTLRDNGHIVQRTSQPCEPDTRLPAELERRDALLEEADPSY